ncbi:MAG: glycosyltransferase family 4 protein [Candidatus Gottesmanbacteria bacterium]|nr:glycosyltransferase family 4 protein [Candidatus Gottesmanbacteria bacterium]
MMKVAVVRGKFLNKYEMQFFEPLAAHPPAGEAGFDITAFGSLTSFHDRFTFPVVKLPSPMDLPDFPYKMPVLNRLFTDAHYLLGLEGRLKGFDLVHTAETYFHYTQQCLNAKKKGYVKKVIATVLENIPFNNEGIRGRREFKMRARAELDHIIALTNKTKAALLQEGADPKKITVISHFIDTKTFYPTKEARQRRAQTRKKLTILFSGRLEWYKGVFDIVEAANKLIHDPKLQQYLLAFVFVGNGSERQKLIDLIHTYGIERHFKFMHVTYNEMNAQYNSAEIFIAPSKPTLTYEEQYCTALLEAQACGLPIVTTRSGGIPENIGDAGILVEPADVSGIAQALKSYILSPKKRILYAARARQRAVQVHDAGIGAKKLAALYTSLF